MIVLIANQRPIRDEQSDRQAENENYLFSEFDGIVDEIDENLSDSCWISI